MALVWNEQHFDRGVSASSSGVGRTRGWNVTGDGASPDLVAQDALSPQFGDEHPDYPGMVVNNVSFLPEGRHTMVRAQYVPREFQDPIPPESEDEEEFIKMDVTFEDVDVEIPIFQLVTKEFPNGPDSTVTMNVWKPIDQKATFRYSRTVHRITLNAMVLGGGGVITQMRIARYVREQANKIHTIDGVKMLFKADSVRRTKIDQYPFTYRWIDDPGIPNTFEFDTSAGPNLMVIGTVGIPYANPSAPGAPAEFTHPDTDNGYILPPYYRVDTSPDGDDPTNPPIITYSKSYIEEPSGYTMLPGVS